MNKPKAIRKVLTSAPDTENFFELSDAERLCRLIGMGFDLGVRAARSASATAAAVSKRSRRRGPERAAAHRDTQEIRRKERAS